MKSSNKLISMLGCVLLSVSKFAFADACGPSIFNDPNISNVTAQSPTLSSQHSYLAGQGWTFDYALSPCSIEWSPAPGGVGFIYKNISLNGKYQGDIPDSVGLLAWYLGFSLVTDYNVIQIPIDPGAPYGQAQTAKTLGQWGYSMLTVIRATLELSGKGLGNQIALPGDPAMTAQEVQTYQQMSASGSTDSQMAVAMGNLIGQQIIDGMTYQQYLVQAWNVSRNPPKNGGIGYANVNTAFYNYLSQFSTYYGSH